MKKPLALVLVLLLVAGCGGDSDDGGNNGSGSSDPLSCDWDSPPLVPDSPPAIPTGREGDLADALVGKWQHTYIVMSDDSIDPNGENIDIRYMLSADRLAYCQHITGAVESGPDRNVADYTLDGDTIDLGGTTYTAVSWNQDVMVWNNDTLGDQQYILQRR